MNLKLLINHPRFYKNFQVPTVHFSNAHGLTSTSALTWAQKNPNRDRLLPHQHTRRINSAVRQLLQAQKKVWHTALLGDLQKLVKECTSRLDEIAKKHSRKVKYLEKLMITSSVFKHARKPNLMNAIIHHKPLEINKGTSLMVVDLSFYPQKNVDLQVGKRQMMQDI